MERNFTNRIPLVPLAILGKNKNTRNSLRGSLLQSLAFLFFMLFSFSEPFYREFRLCFKSYRARREKPFFSERVKGGLVFLFGLDQYAQGRTGLSGRGGQGHGQSAEERFSDHFPPCTQPFRQLWEENDGFSLF